MNSVFHCQEHSSFHSCRSTSVTTTNKILYDAHSMTIY
jgi:hypothetical protein